MQAYKDLSRQGWVKCPGPHSCEEDWNLSPVDSSLVRLTKPVNACSSALQPGVTEGQRTVNAIKRILEPLPNCVKLGTLLNLSEVPFPQLQMQLPKRAGLNIR